MENQNGCFLPDYFGMNGYETLCGFADRMGIEIIYRDSKDFAESILAFSDVYDLEDGRHKCIIMPQDDKKIISAGKDPSAVLAHEITHYLIEEYYRDDKVVNARTCYPIRLMLENDCDRMGLAIYLLADAIASEEEGDDKLAVPAGEML